MIVSRPLPFESLRPVSLERVVMLIPRRDFLLSCEIC